MVKKVKILYYLQYTLITILKLDMKKRKKIYIFLFQFGKIKTFWNGGGDGCTINECTQCHCAPKNG